ncbi:MAG TPA: lysylphosphatidylglycerol synthase transmembrane domain-containing protein [Dehalococcoidia bacterium]|nr:lysylphosphatidylglycerol synthase transmembrane domain-containing protein [Dehalococcoidia bacterium]
MLRRKRFWLGLIITVAFLGFFLARTDFNDIRNAFRDADYPLAFAAIPLYFVGFWIRTIRWRLLLNPVSRVSTRRLYPVVLIGLMTNNIAPARVGELVRAFLVGERESMSKSTAMGTIAVDRAFDGLTLVAILGIVTAFSGGHASVRIVGVITALLFAAGTAALAGLALLVTARSWLARLLQMLPGHLALKLGDVVDAFLTGLVAIRSPLVLLKAAMASVASWLVESSMYWVVGQAFDLDVGIEAYLLIVAAANLALSLLASPGGVGPFEFTAKQILLSFGVPSGVATAYSLALHALLLGPVIIVGFVILSLSQFSLSQIMGISRPSVAPTTAPPVAE